MSKLSHTDEAGAARMVDVTAKAETARTATATGRIDMNEAARTAIADGTAAKGDVFAAARIAGIMAAKKTSDLIPLCHPLPITGITLDLALDEAGATATATVKTSGKTGVEMEALTAASVALLTLYDMLKAVDKHMVIGAIHVTAKAGGKSGDWVGMSLLPIEEAQARLLALAPALSPERVSLVDAAGRYLAEPLTAQRDQPWTALSAMDGYAVRWADMPGPWRLAGEIQAGALPPKTPLAPGATMRIFTGAPMPPGADTVVLQEDVSAQGDLISLTGDGPGAMERHVRPRGSDFAAGKALLPAGTRLGAPQIALAALAGHASLAVRARPRVAILSTGDELVPAGAPCPPGKLPASNGLMLRAMIEAAGALVVSEQIIGDDLAAITTAIEAARTADIIVTSGGASVGDHDLVRPALEAAGGAIDFWRIAMRPGKPLIVGRLGQAIFLGLPGNPVSAMVTGALFLLPLVRHLAGSANPLPTPRTLPLGAAMPAVGKRAELVRAIVGDGVISPIAFQDSAAMHAAALANALIYRPVGAPAANAGESVPLLDWAALGLS